MTAQDALTRLAGALVADGWAVEMTRTDNPALLVRCQRAGSTQKIDRTSRELTVRQQQVLAHVQAGMTTQAIAVRLGISARGVAVYRTQIRLRLGLAPRTDLRSLSSDTVNVEREPITAQNRASQNERADVAGVGDAG